MSPLILATRSLRLLGIVCCIYGIFFAFAYGYFNRYERYQVYFIAMGMVLWVIPGAVFLVNARQLEQRQRRGAICAICISVMQGAMALALFIMQFFLPPMSPIPLVL